MPFDQAEIARLRLCDGDLLTCEGGDIGRTAIWNGEVPDCLYQNHLHRLRRHKDNVDPRFYMLWMEAAFTIWGRMEGQGNTSTIPNLSKERLAAFEVPLPPLEEQLAIAEVLMAVRRAKEATEKVIAATKEFKKSLMRHLFTYGPVPVHDAPNVKLKQTEIGEMPEHWGTSRIGDIAEVKGGKRLPKGHAFADAPTSWPYLRVVDMVDGSIRSTHLRYLTEADAVSLKRYTIEPEHVYISIAGTIGNVGRVPLSLKGAFLTENAARIVLRTKKVGSQFLYYYLSTDRAQSSMKERVTGGAQPKLALVRIADLPVAFPPIDEQDLICAQIDAGERKLRSAVQERATLDTLFQSLLHNLMTGQVRVPPFGDGASSELGSMER